MKSCWLFCRRTRTGGDVSDYYFRILLVLLLLRVDYFLVLVLLRGLFLNSRKMRWRQVGATIELPFHTKSGAAIWVFLKPVSVVFEGQVGHGRAVLPSGCSTKNKTV
jgi:hypothetical protein